MSSRNRRIRPLSANHLLVHKALEKAGRPVSAYDLLGELRGKGVTAPPTVYRALKRLTKDGQVHRIESLNAYVVCAVDHAHHNNAGFAICDDCGSVTEFPSEEIQAPVEEWAKETAFQLAAVSLELHGRCDSCVSVHAEKLS